MNFWPADLRSGKKTAVLSDDEVLKFAFKIVN